MILPSFLIQEELYEIDDDQEEDREIHGETIAVAGSYCFVIHDMLPDSRVPKGLCPLL